MPNETAPITIDLGNLRRVADRQREDAETIAQLCDGMNALLEQNKSLGAKLAKVEEERDAFKARLAKHEPQVVEGKDGKK